MARISIALNKEPHVVDVDGTELLFRPEISGAEFAQAYAGLQEAQKTASAGGDTFSTEALLAVTEALREFLSDLMLPESREAFAGMPLPDRFLVKMLEFLSEQYGGGASERPTGRSGGSPASRRTPGTR